MNTFLPSLYQEFQDLKAKMNTVSNLILMYGGNKPDFELPIITTPPTVLHTPTFNTKETKVSPIPKFTSYPKNGQWKDKILFAMHQLNTPSTAKEISEWIIHEEKVEDVGKVFKSVTQYTSNMAKEGLISADTSNFKHLYFLVS